jgi:hypothetical protein
MMIKSQLESSINSIYDRYRLAHQNKSHHDQTTIEKLKTIQVRIYCSFSFHFFSF